MGGRRNDHNEVIMSLRLLNDGIVVSITRSTRLLADASSPRGCQLVVMRRMADGFGAIRNPFVTRVTRERSLDLRGMWIVASGAAATNGVILYLHGGGFVFGSTRSHFGLAKRLSLASGMAVFVVDYRLAPEAQFPAAADDVLGAYGALLGRGYSAARIALAGDSAGGQLVASLLNDVRASGMPMPAGALMMSPVLDLSGDNAVERDRVRRDPVLSAVYGKKCLSAYLGDTPPSDPRLALIEAPKRGWPRVLIQVGDTECILDDSRAMATSLTAAGVVCELEIWEGQVHVFQSLARYLPQARQALWNAGEFLSAAVDSATAAQRGRTA